MLLRKVTALIDEPSNSRIPDLFLNFNKLITLQKLAAESSPESVGLDAYIKFKFGNGYSTETLHSYDENPWGFPIL